MNYNERMETDRRRAATVKVQGSAVTFAEKREQLLRNLDQKIADLRVLLTDPTLTNDLYPPYVKAHADIAWACKAMLTLNQAEQA